MIGRGFGVRGARIACDELESIAVSFGFGLDRVAGS